MKPSLVVAFRCCFVSILFTLLPLASSAQQNEPQVREIRLPDSALVRDTRLPDWAPTALPLPDNKSDEPFFVRLSDTYVRLGDQTTYLVKRVSTANTAASLRDLGQLDVVFQPDYQQVKLHAIRILRGSDQIDMLDRAKVRFVQRERDVENAIFTGWVTATIVVEDLRVGDALELQYSLIGQNPVFGNRLFDGAGLEFSVASGVRRYTIDAPASRKVNVRVIGGSAQRADLKPEIITSNGRTLTRFTSRNSGSQEIDQYAPSDYSPLRWVQASEFASWKEVVGWAQGLFRTEPLPAEAQSLLRELRAIRDPEKQILRALKFVQADIRYVSMSLGENSHRPFSPSQVLSRRYGDCKDKSLLLVSLLREVGIQAWPVLVSTDYRRNLDTLLPSPTNFDHAIVKVALKDRRWFLDATLPEQSGTLDTIGDAHTDTLLLVVQDGNDRLERTPAARDALITIERAEHFRLKSMDEPAELDIEIQFAGLNAESVRHGFRNAAKEQIRKFYSGYLDRRYNQAELLQDPVIEDDQERNTLRLRLRYRVTGFAEKDQNDWNMRYLASNLTEQFYVPTNGRRTSPLALPSYPFVGRYGLRITLPENFDAKRTPYDKVIEEPGYRFEQHLTLNGREAQAHVELRITSDRIDASRVPTFLNNLRLSNAMLSSSFSVDTRDIRVERPNIPFKQTVRQHYEEVVASTTQRLPQASKLGVSPVDLLCERALAEAYLGQLEAARKDAESALHDNADSRAAVYCRSVVQLMERNVIASHAGFSRLVALGDNSHDLWMRRALSAYHLGRYEDARGDFARAMSAGNTDSQRERANYWQALCELRLGRPVTTTSTTAAWPAPGLALLKGAISPEKLLADIQASASGDALEVQLAEGYLFIAQYLQQRGQEIKRQAYLRLSLEKGMIFTFAHQASLLEIAVLKP
ncbi:DUF3857 domain-containing protein [Viridibacterium curvum]|uniref:DUF3857 domain-containing protein n=1 Tax=Viridibacterium curvum TaxID=1101404 RepID=A0ABP9QST1_9RHOO